MTHPLLSPLDLGALRLPNRVIMAPLTRCRAAEGRLPTALMAEYYAQRAGAGLILSEAVAVCPDGVGYPDTPGLWTRGQTEAWRPVTAAVHQRGGRIFAQLWHVGRVSDPHYLDGRLPVAPSPIALSGHVRLLRPERPHVTPRALPAEEIPDVIAAFRQAAENAIAAGFDGVEIHAANGYLIDQFLQDRSNQRTDAWGGPIESRSRLLLEVADACIAACGADRVGVHLAPRGPSHDMGDSDPAALFGHVARELGRRRIAFLCTREAEAADAFSPALRRAFGGVFIANEDHSPASAARLVAAGGADAVAFGRLFISNPDLPARIATDAPLADPDPTTFYFGGPRGYTDYPATHL